MTSAAVTQILDRAEQTLATARYGYDDLVNEKSPRRTAGLRNLITAGRSVTWVIQNLRSVVGTEVFDAWWFPAHSDIASGSSVEVPLRGAQNEIENQGKTPRITTVVKQTGVLSVEEMEKISPKPPGATGAFMGDDFGGSGWCVPGQASRKSWLGPTRTAVRKALKK